MTPPGIAVVAHEMMQLSNGASLSIGMNAEAVTLLHRLPTGHVQGFEFPKKDLPNVIETLRAVNVELALGEMMARMVPSSMRGPSGCDGNCAACPVH